MMSTFLYPSVLAAIFLSFGIYKYIVYPAFLSPLSKVPAAHWSVPFSPIWLYWLRWTKQENMTIHQLHLEKGEAVRLAPTELSLNCFRGGLKEIYLGGFPKTNFYFRGFANYRTHNIFTYEDNATHTARKRKVANTFSKSYINASPTARGSTRDVLFRRLMPIVEEAAANDHPLEILELNYAYSFDSFVQWQFGRSLGSNLIQDTKERRMYLEGFFGLSAYTFWTYHFPGLVSLLRSAGLPLIPKCVESGVEEIEDWNMNKCDKAQQLLATGNDLELSDEDQLWSLLKH